jgi:transketolase
MRTAFIRALTDAAVADPRVMLVVGDLGFSVVEEFAARMPLQYLNVGVAEQNMTGVAAGLALSGRIVLTYSIANFPTLRCLEQIRNDVCYHRANVKIVAVGGGFAYGALGVSHHALEDIAIMRTLPNMTVLAPADPYEAREATRAAIALPGPVYLRLGKAGEPAVHQGAPTFEVGKALKIRAGRDLTLISTGGMLSVVTEAADRLAQIHGLDATVLSMHTLRPLDETAVREAATSTPLVVTVEEHGCVGGLGGAVAEVIAEMEAPRARLKRVAAASEFLPVVGDQKYLRERAGLTAEAIVSGVAAMLGGRVS